MNSKNESDTLIISQGISLVQNNQNIINSNSNNNDNKSNSLIDNDSQTPESSHCQFLKQSILKHSQLSNSMIRNNSLNSALYYPCIICDKFFKKTNFVSSPDCEHVVCLKCGKYYYEEKIEQGETKFKCPKYKCDGEIDVCVIQKIVSTLHYESLIKIRKRQETFDELKDSQIKLQQVKIYLQRNVIDVNDNELFYLYHNRKFQFCPQCNEYSLYTKSGDHYIKCLNCCCRLCRYCFKQYTMDHMDRESVEHCKVFYRRSEQNIKKKSCIWDYLLQLFFVIASFIMVFIAYYNYIYILLNKLCCCCCRQNPKNNICCLIILIPINIIIFFIGMPLILLSLPYFPIILEATT